MSQYQPSEIRISDSEREDALGKLGEHMSAGRLDIDEYGERSAMVATAKTRGELLALFGDLPEPKPTFGQPSQGSAPARRERTFVEKFVPVAAPVAVLLLVAAVLILLKIPFFLPFLFVFIFMNHRRGPGNRWDGRGRGRPRGMGHERG
ncbi:DUF1707 SHOCT-like domain-containing protein [Actinophytocola oryzae]|uniref:DUF1707 SHOCT-like domain-containing protein n=1 Tax=Actinophytocola oryzae TaxID=502181 RepID=UPI001FBAC71D|nr:DUF1707 domain-containing protein [Actinophytocola oryzae]